MSSILCFSEGKGKLVVHQLISHPAKTELFNWNKIISLSLIFVQKGYTFPYWILLFPSNKIECLFGTTPYGQITIEQLKEKLVAMDEQIKVVYIDYWFFLCEYFCFLGEKVILIFMSAAWIIPKRVLQ